MSVYNRVLSRLGLYKPKWSSFELDNTFPDRPLGTVESHIYRHEGRPIHKWRHYPRIYDRYLAPLTNRPSIRLLEIGVDRGGSLELWRTVFGPSATIFGIDINPACRKLDGEAGSVRIGSQADPAFLRSVVTEMGGVDIVIDDGSHDSVHLRESFKVLFPLLAQDGLYIAEDLHCSYWRRYHGAYRRQGTFIEFAKDLVDGMHRWYHPHGARYPEVAAVHFYDSVVVVEKGEVVMPKRIEFGQ